MLLGQSPLRKPPSHCEVAPDVAAEALVEAVGLDVLVDSCLARRVLACRKLATGSVPMRIAHVDEERHDQQRRHGPDEPPDDEPEHGLLLPGRRWRRTRGRPNRRPHGPSPYVRRVPTSASTLDGRLAGHEVRWARSSLVGGVPDAGSSGLTSVEGPRRVGALGDRVEARRPLLGADDDLAVTVDVLPLAEVLERSVVDDLGVDRTTDLVRAPRRPSSGTAPAAAARGRSPSASAPCVTSSLRAVLVDRRRRPRASACGRLLVAPAALVLRPGGRSPRSGCCRRSRPASGTAGSGGAVLMYIARS